MVKDLRVILQFCLAVWLVWMKHNVVFIHINSFYIIIFIDYVIIIECDSTSKYHDNHLAGKAIISYCTSKAKFYMDLDYITSTV